MKVLDILNRCRALVKGVDENSRKVHGIIVADENGLRYMNEMRIEISGMVLNIDSIGVERGAIRSVILSRTSSTRIESIIVGIDYGERIGVAVLVNSDVVFINSYRNKIEALKVVRMFIDSIDAERKIVRIGLPNKPHKGYDDFVVRLSSMLKESAIVEFISEDGSSKRKLEAENIKDEDSLAAVNIALQRIYSDEV
ncbi:MAG: hypothetical protein N3D82_02585 [Ignisphaera sp.]|nr:hypothetical protein [Ignisphaera sp.]MCX8167905.1 hypothetical protein [Ignisphaera sp.]MDW8085720.1 hypothetical protein [Ignisphaera sp.]